MCNFLSSIYLQTGRLICEPWHTLSHDDMLSAHQIREQETIAPVQHFVRLELLPPDGWDGSLDDPDQWREFVDESTVPAWFDDAARFNAFEGMRDVLRHAERSENGRLYTECLLLAMTVCMVRHAFVIAHASSMVDAYAGSTIIACKSSTIYAREGSTIIACEGSTIYAHAGSTVTRLA